MLDEIVPASVVVEEALDDPGGLVLFPEEEAVLARAVDKRRREFATTRMCARRALARLGMGPVPVLPGERGAPGWPAGIVGSITHCTGYRAAALARARDLAGLGIDAEPNERVPQGVLRLIARPEEHARLAALEGAMPAVCADRLLFSAKESVYKAWFPLTRRWLGFDEASLSFDVPGGTFTAQVLADHPTLNRMTGRWLLRDGLLLTAVALPPA